MTKILNLKLILLLLVFINIGLPINDHPSYLIFIISFILIIFNQTKALAKKSIYYFSVIFFLTIINIFFVKFEKIEEAHSSFITKTDLNLISKFLPSALIENLYNDLNKFDYQRYFEGRQAPANDRLFIKNSYAFSSDSFFQKNKYTRQIFDIDFKNRSEHRIGQFNTEKFKMPYDQDLKENFPFYVFYELNDNFKGSEICGKGNLFISSSPKNQNIDKLKFKRFGDIYECIKLNNDNNNSHYIFAYSIGDYDNFNIKLNLNNKLIFIKYLKIFIIISIALILILNFIKLRINRDLIIITISIISSFILAYFNDPNVLFNLRHIYGGSDGLIFNSFASDIVENLKNLKFLLVLRGGEDVYYFQPGMRYYVSIFKIIFGETNFGYIFLVAFFPYLIFLLFKKITNKNIAYILFFIFIFFPIFESIGFGHFNYIRQAVRLHAESLSIILLIISIYIFFIEEDKNIKSNVSIIFVALLFSQAIFLRPNFLPTCLILSFYLIYSNILNKNILSKNLLFVFFFTPTLFCLIHNLYFGNEFVIFSSASIHIIFTKNLSSLNFTEANNLFHFILIQLKDWNDFVYFPRLIILFYVIFYIRNYKVKELIFYLIICCILQHVVLLLTHAGSRYAYFAWLLTFILFVKISYDNNHLNIISEFLKIKKLYPRKYR